MYNNSNNIHCNPTAWVIQQHLYVPQQQYNQHQQIILAHISESSSKLKHKEVVLYKTESCRNWNELGHCRYGKKCRYAHGLDELRKVPRHTRYKTQICRAYHMDGSCPYGIRCTFVHDSDIQPREKMTGSPDIIRGNSLHDDEASSLSGSSSGDESLTGNNDFSHNYYRQNVKDFTMKQQNSIETMQCYNNVFSNNRTTMWM